MAKKLTFNGVELFMLPQKVLYIPSYHLLVLSDWHIGKLGHFRKAGLFVPPMRLDEEFSRLAVLLNELSVREVIFLGDLFHSEWNYEWDEFQRFLQGFPTVKFLLTRGNHDILPEAILKASVIQVKDYVLLAEGIVFSHEPIKQLDAAIYNIVGHIHPGCEVAVKGRQYYKLPCFYLEDKVLTLPAFGRWTGLYMLTKRQDNRVFAVVGNADVIELKY
ncbi:ligase-associated DNA damage response endonuclease PdeM [Sphingobacterium oryzagri]|uniref:Ligase-associated DNA damage response endonuclease PdeM n=1 Tax=Sphingobacterium oryzagri TaxID=3025669 RepID=A0ABY7WDA1_9SPHI|nr:ligase-associated DNA damage response endonuclease PdeM [Sphingobacterium sp. KACC 22765]WDF67627.1 ligase-associated DNA damage response endonuclease PdeM [Sphingobacterium sp. KACC 22765]